MKTTRRTALKAVAGFLLAPTLMLRQEIDREALLRAFCEPDSVGLRYDMETPFRVGGLSYATDIRYICRAELSAPREDGGERRIPPVERLWKELWLPGDFRPLDIGTLPLRRTEYPRCPYCGDRRISLGECYPPADWLESREAGDYGYDVDDNSIRDKSCTACHGLDFQGPSVVDFGDDVFMDRWRLNPIIALPNVEWSMSQINHERAPLLFRADGFEGMCMGIKPDMVRS